ncbi:MAG: hypothetical protein KDD66_14030 [Bdellovibrionales bacterium]|nr:hypothetical protein [Bdellovibrionales bacterium]
MNREFKIAALYQFGELPADKLESWAHELEQFGRSRGVIGLLLLAVEGINGTVAGPNEALDAFVSQVFTTIPLAVPEIKFSKADRAPFPRLKVRVREEIVTFRAELPAPDINDDSHLSPAEWQGLLESEENLVLLDTRNYYETELGMFEGALDPKIDSFTDLSDFLDRAAIPKEQKVLMYCTGGIRCEKAALEMKRRGYEEVFQLQGGILNYLAHYPNGKFNGECFVFDHRVAVDGDLEPSRRYHLCPHCGDPGDRIETCPNCGGISKVCAECVERDPVLATCSKNCAYHARLARDREVSSPK